LYNVIYRVDIFSLYTINTSLEKGFEIFEGVNVLILHVINKHSCRFKGCERWTFGSWLPRQGLQCTEIAYNAALAACEYLGGLPSVKSSPTPNKKRQESRRVTHMIHGTGIFAYIYKQKST